MHVVAYRNQPKFQIQMTPIDKVWVKSMILTPRPSLSRTHTYDFLCLGVIGLPVFYDRRYSNLLTTALFHLTKMNMHYFFSMIVEVRDTVRKLRVAMNKRHLWLVWWGHHHRFCSNFVYVGYLGCWSLIWL